MFKKLSNNFALSKLFPFLPPTSSILNNELNKFYLSWLLCTPKAQRHHDITIGLTTSTKFPYPTAASTQVEPQDFSLPREQNLSVFCDHLCRVRCPKGRKKMLC